MPTAIIVTYTGAGFIIVADGIARDKKNNVTSRTKRKIFIFGGGKSLAYAFAGRVAIGPDEGPGFSFDFRNTINGGVQALSMNRFATLTAFATRLATHTQRILRDACRKAQIKFADTEYPMDTTVAYVIISGYFKEVPASVEIRFYRHNRRFAKPEVSPHPLRIGILARKGSELMNFLFTNKNPRFVNNKYFRPLEVPVPHLSEAMVEAIIESRAYIKACESAEGRSLDKVCKTIGGRIHIAVITATEGFDWVPGFLPKGIKPTRRPASTRTRARASKRRRGPLAS